MNVSELARKLKINSKELLEILPAVGFDFGRRAIKIDDRQAQKIINQWPQLLAKYRQQLSEVKKEETETPDDTILEKKIIIPPFIRVRDFAEKLKLPLSKVISELMKNGVLAAMNEVIDFETAAIISQELGYEVVAEAAGAKEIEQEKNLSQIIALEQKADLQPRPPVVVVMGHVDHGKTKLLDAIRKTKVMEGESGGITQHIGAYQVTFQSKNETSSRPQGGILLRPLADRDDGAASRAITFIDTPGHEAFSTMRSRGARVADIAILVVAADDSIQPQTKESIKIIHSAGLPMIVAINKIDKPEANVEKVKQDLAAINLLPEDWGGKTICVPISAKAGLGLDDLLEMILLVAETEKEKLMANPNRSAAGTIIESHIDRGEGPVSTILIQNGSLKTGDLVEISGVFYGKIRAMKNFLGQDVKIATPSMPIKILGLKAAPSVGDVLQVITDETKTRKVKKYQMRNQAVDYAKPLETKEKEESKVTSLNLVLRADVLGSLEALISSLTKLEHPEVAVNIISKGLGHITENDVSRAEAGHSVIFGFHVKPSPAAENLAKEKNVEILSYSVIYKLLDEAKARLEKLLKPEVIHTELGRLKVLAIFRQDKNAMIIGGSVSKGKILPNAKADIFRDKVKIGTGVITQLQVNKVNVNEATQGQECGLKFEGKSTIAVNDILEIYQEEVKQKKII